MSFTDSFFVRNAYPMKDLKKKRILKFKIQMKRMSHI